jgi:hypothetical protein
VVARKMNNQSPKCLEVNIDIRRGTQANFVLIPITPTTMPAPQSPLCVMLNEALSAPNAVHWAWPPVSNLETASSGVADDRLALSAEASRAVPTVEQTFAHALPRQGTGLQDKAGGFPASGHAAAIELGHLLSFVAVECPVDWGQPPDPHRRNAETSPINEEDASIFFDFSAEWLESIYQTGGCSVVGYFRYLNLFDFASSQGEHGSTLPARAAAPIVGVIDHYLFQNFSYEGRAFMLLQAVSFFCKEFSSLCDDPRHGSGSVRHAGFPVLPVLMRCRITHLPAVRLFQKLHRVFVGESNESQGTGYQGGNRDRHGFRKGRQAPRVRLTPVAHGGILHIRLSPDLVDDVSVRLCDKVTTPRIWTLNRTGCVVQSERGLVPPTPTPFDAIVERHRARWLIENAPFRKHTYKSVGSDGEEGEGGLQSIQQPRSVSGGPDRKTAQIGPQPSRLSLVDPVTQLPGRGETTAMTGTLPFRLGFHGGIHSRDGNSSPSSTVSDVSGRPMSATDRWGYSASSVEHLQITENLTSHIRSLRQSTDRYLGRGKRSMKRRGQNFADSSILPMTEQFFESNAHDREVVSGPVQRSVNDYVGHPIFVAECRPERTSRQRHEPGFLQVGTPIQVNSGDGLWTCGYWLEALRQLTLHWFDPTRSDNALLEHFGPIWIRDLADENRLITPTSTSGKVYVAVAPHVRVFPSPQLEGKSMEVRTFFG